MVAVPLESVFTVVDAIYEAAFDQERWGNTVVLLRNLFHGSRACILRFGQYGPDAVSSIRDPELNSPTGMEAVVRDPFSHKMITMPVGAVWQRAAIVDEASFRKRELWQDWFGPRDMHSQLVCKLASSRTEQWLLDVNRGPKQEAFGAADIDLMNRIAPHMVRAGEISRKLTGKRAASTFLNMPFSLLLVNGDRRLLQANEAAEQLLALPDGPLKLRHGLVGASNPAATQDLSRLVADACSLRDGSLPDQLVAFDNAL